MPCLGKNGVESACWQRAARCCHAGEHRNAIAHSADNSIGFLYLKTQETQQDPAYPDRPDLMAK